MLSCLLDPAPALCAPPQTSYSDDGVFVTLQAACGNFSNSSVPSSALTALFVFSKSQLYTTPGPNGTLEVHRATYLPNGAWYRSLPQSQLLLNFYPESDNDVNPFNALILPSRPQSLEDVDDPVFVMGKVSRLTRASLTLHMIWCLSFAEIVAMMCIHCNQRKDDKDHHTC